MQEKLNQDQRGKFYSDRYAEELATRFRSLIAAGGVDHAITILDIGGDAGYFAKAISAISPAQITVIYLDPKATNYAKLKG
jgi:hypothetical protein